MSPTRAAAIIVLSAILSGSSADAQSLKGSRTSLQKQNSVARQHDFSYLRTSVDVDRFVDRGYLVRVGGNADYRLVDVSFPYARPEVKTFVERLARQYRGRCGEQLVVTSLTRPTTRQPRNASDMSVHPTGMALDLRRSNKDSCRRWIEDTLLSLERRGVLEATRENRPPHYHVALFPEPYMRYVSTLLTERAGARLAASDGGTTHRVHKGDTLWGIARRYGTTVDELKRANNLRTPTIRSGQVLTIPQSAR